MNSKSKIKIYKKLIEEVCRKQETAREFINNTVNELCFQEGISTEEVRLYFLKKIKRLETYSLLEYLFLRFVMLRTQVRANLFSLYSIKIVFCFEM